MPIVLPGLFDFSTGVSSAINQNSGRLANQGQVLNNYLSTLNAFNASLNTNDNLEFRRGFAAQDTNTPVLDRFANFAQNTTNPFALGQSATAAASLAPALGGLALRNPTFAQGQGLPSDLQGLINSGTFGINATLQNQFNNQLPQFLSQNNQGPDLNTLVQFLQATGALNNQNNNQADDLKARTEQQTLALNKQILDTVSQNNGTNTNNQTSTNQRRNNRIGFGGLTPLAGVPKFESSTFIPTQSNSTKVGG